MTTVFITRASHWAVPNQLSAVAMSQEQAARHAQAYCRHLGDELYGTTSWPLEAMQAANSGDWAKLLRVLQLAVIEQQDGEPVGESYAAEETAENVAERADFNVWIEEHDTFPKTLTNVQLEGAQGITFPVVHFDSPPCAPSCKPATLTVLEAYRALAQACLHAEEGDPDVTIATLAAQAERCMSLDAQGEPTIPVYAQAKA